MKRCSAQDELPSTGTGRAAERGWRPSEQQQPCLQRLALQPLCATPRANLSACRRLHSSSSLSRILLLLFRSSWAAQRGRDRGRAQASTGCDPTEVGSAAARRGQDQEEVGTSAPHACVLQPSGSAGLHTRGARRRGSGQVGWQHSRHKSGEGNRGPQQHGCEIDSASESIRYDLYCTKRGVPPSPLSFSRLATSSWDCASYEPFSTRSSSAVCHSVGCRE